MGKLGDIYYEGTEKIQPNAEKALFYYTEAIKNGHSSNLFNIAQIYQNGIHPRYSPIRFCGPQVQATGTFCGLESTSTKIRVGVL